MSCTEVKTFTRFAIPDGIPAEEKLVELIDQIATEGLATWFEDSNPMKDCFTWQQITEEYGDEEEQSIKDVTSAREALKETISEMITLNYSRSTKKDHFHIFANCEELEEQVHDLIVKVILQDKDMNTTWVKSHGVIEDSREGMRVSSWTYSLSANGDLNYTEDILQYP